MGDVSLLHRAMKLRGAARACRAPGSRDGVGASTRCLPCGSQLSMRTLDGKKEC